jgi:hypothetical protein
MDACIAKKRTMHAYMHIVLSGSGEHTTSRRQGNIDLIGVDATGGYEEKKDPRPKF